MKWTYLKSILNTFYSFWQNSETQTGPRSEESEMKKSRNLSVRVDWRIFFFAPHLFLPGLLHTRIADNKTSLWHIFCIVLWELEHYENHSSHTSIILKFNKDRIWIKLLKKRDINTGSYFLFNSLSNWTSHVLMIKNVSVLIVWSGHSAVFSFQN